MFFTLKKILQPAYDLRLIWLGLQGLQAKWQFNGQWRKKAALKIEFNYVGNCFSKLLATIVQKHERKVQL